ncbi:RIP metalloprotease RseP [Candidatus Wolfebacteria bacterium]|nr:RIP metalloprotease RseP [Candidatus Wolfebacteria bacterium]
MFLSIIIVLIFLSVLILAHELGHFLTAKKFGLLVEEFGFGLPPRIWGKKIGETIYSINALPFGGFVKIFGEDGDAEQHGTDADSRGNRSFLNLSLWRRAIIIFAGVFMNFLLGWFLISIIFSIGIPQALIITEIRPESPAAKAGIKNGDKILGIESGSGPLATELNSRNFTEFVKNNQGREVSLKIKRAGEEINFKLIPRVNPLAGEGFIGVGLADAGIPKKNIAESMWESLKASLFIIKAVFLGIISLIIKALSGKAGFEQVSGPVGIVKITAEAGGMGFIYLLQLLSLISLNLAVINIFPFPALDGGRLLFLLIEKIKGSPLPPKFERYANSFGIILLLSLMALITIKDVIKLF